MSYRPKYCCQCGDEIDRPLWKPWTSRRFCQLCATEFGVYDWLSRGVFGIGLLIGLLGIGAYLQKPEKPLSVAPVHFASGAPVQRSESVNLKTVAQIQTNSGVQPPAQTYNAVAQAKQQTTANLKTKPLVTAPTEPTEKVYFCGATTKKGTMCSRRVRGGGRCWQHEGQSAMVSQEKLLASK